MINVPKIEISSKQAEYIKNATHRWNVKIGAVQCGKTYVDTLFIIADRIIERINKPRSSFYSWSSKRNYSKKRHRAYAGNMGN